MIRPAGPVGQFRASAGPGRGVWRSFPGLRKGCQASMPAPMHRLAELRVTWTRMAGNDAPSRSPALPTVQLRHELPDGSHHIDWLLGQDPDGSRPLISFRIDQPVSDLKEGQSLTALRIADHRPAYLEYEGPVSPNRGIVRRLCRGRVLAWRKPEDGRWELEIVWKTESGSEIHQQLCLHRQDLERWTVFLCPQIGSLR